MSLTTLKGIIAFIFSFPFVVFMNVLWGFLSFMAAFTVDKSKFPINCELDNLVTVGAGGIKSIGYIASDTAVALRAAEFGVPEFISTPIVPIFFGLVWLVKFSSLKDKSFGLCVINLILAILTFSALFIGFSSKLATWWDVEEIKRKLVNNNSLLTSYSYAVNEAIDSTEIIREKSTCYIAVEMYLLEKQSICENDDFPSCYVNFIANESKYQLLEAKRQQWLHDVN